MADEPLIKLIARIMNPKPLKVVTTKNIHEKDPDAIREGIALEVNTFAYSLPYITTGVMFAMCGPLGLLAFPVAEKFVGKKISDVIPKAQELAAKTDTKNTSFKKMSDIQKHFKDQAEKSK